MRASRLQESDRGQISGIRRLPEISQVINVIRRTVVPHFRQVGGRDVVLIVGAGVELKRIVVAGIGRFGRAVKAVGRGSACCGSGRCAALRGNIRRGSGEASLEPSPRNIFRVQCDR